MPTVRYLVRDVDVAVPFYEALGFRVVERHGSVIAITERKGLTLWIAGPEASASRRLSSGAQPEPGGWNRFVIEVDDLDAEIAKLRERGVHFRGDPVGGPGGRQVVVDDPSGNAIEFFQPRNA
jgi:catechol 2,3-dioxygenase-like lactoylglutathione lyase family enzyme